MSRFSLSTNCTDTGVSEKNEWCHDRGKSEEAIGRISYHSVVRVSDFLACVPFYLNTVKRNVAPIQVKLNIFIFVILLQLCVYTLYI